MEIVCLNAAFEVVGYLPYINLQWTRRYFETGEFSAQIRMQDYDPAVRYLWTADRPEIAMVEKTQSSTEITGRYVQLSGRFMEGALDRNVIWPKKNATGRPSKLARDLVAQYATDIPGLIVSTWAGDSSEDTVEVKYLGEPLDEATWPLLESVGKSQRITFDFEQNALRYQIWQGKNRTQSQNQNAYALFSDVAQNTEKISIDEDESGYRNYAIIGLPNGQSLTVDRRSPPDEPRRILFVDETEGQPDPDQTEAQWKSALTREARETLAKWPRVVNVEAVTIQSGILYLQDYDLGDVCDIVSNDMRKSYESRIIEVREVFKEMQHQVEVIFGDKIPTIFERVKNK